MHTCFFMAKFYTPTLRLWGECKPDPAHIINMCSELVHLQPEITKHHVPALAQCNTNVADYCNALRQCWFPVGFVSYTAE